MAIEKEFPHLLLVEDASADIELVREVIREANIKVQLSVVRDGIETMEFLHRRGKFLNAPRPDLVLLDLNLPRKDGREVLKELKSDPSSRLFPIIVFTTSNAPQDIDWCYRHGANCYIRKPFNYSELIAVLQRVCDFWLNTALLPSHV